MVADSSAERGAPSSPIRRDITKGKAVMEWNDKNVSTSRWQYHMLTLLESSHVKRVASLLVVVYLFSGMLQILLDLDLICLYPKIEPSLEVDTSPTMFLQVSSRNILKRSIHRAEDHQYSLDISRPKFLQAVKATAPALEKEPAQLQCLSPYSTTWLHVSIAFNIICLCISSLLFSEHLCRMMATSPAYYYHHWVLLQDLVVTGLCFFGDFCIVVFLTTRALQGLNASCTENCGKEDAVFFLCILRFALSYRIYLHLRNEYHPASEVCRTVEVLDLMQQDMPGIMIKSVKVIRNELSDVRAYAERREALNQMRDEVVEEKLLFVGSGSIPPSEILDDREGLTKKHTVAMQNAAGRQLGTRALYGAERPAFSDCCAFVDPEDESGRTREILIYQALIGSALESQGSDSGLEGVEPVFDSLVGGPWTLVKYTPDDFGLQCRDTASKIYAMREPRNQVLLVASVRYENPDSFAEIEKLKFSNATTWAAYQEHKVKLSPVEEKLLQALAEAIESGNKDVYLETEKECQEAKISKEHIDRVKKEKREESENAGVSLAYILSEEFLHMAQEATGQDDPTFSEMSVPFFMEERNSCPRIGAGLMCPRDLMLGAALIDTLPRKFRRKATHFMSWVWRYRLSIVREALRRWLMTSGEDAENVFLYICFCCNNQWRILVDKQASGSDNLELVFESRLRKIGHMIAVMDQWENSLYISRIWTIFEQYVAAKLGIDMSFILPEEPSETMIEQLELGRAGILNVIDAISHVDCVAAKATMPEDETKVKALISSTVGFQKVNEQVKHSITAWVAKEFKARIDSMVA